MRVKPEFKINFEEIKKFRREGKSAFEIKTGKPVYGSGRLKTFEVLIKNDEIWIKIEDEQT